MMHSLYDAKCSIYANNSFDNVRYRVKPYCAEKIQMINRALRGAQQKMLSTHCYYG